MSDKTPSALLSLFACRLSERLLCALLQTSALKGERASFRGDSLAHSALAKRASHLLREGRSAQTSLALTSLLEALVNGLVSVVSLHARVDSLRLERVFKLLNAVSDLVLGILKLHLCNVVEFLGLLQLEFELLALAVPLAFLIFLPVLDAFLVPLLHEAGVALQFIYLNTAHFLLAHGLHLDVLSV